MADSNGSRELEWPRSIRGGSGRRCCWGLEGLLEVGGDEARFTIRARDSQVCKARKNPVFTYA